MPLRKILTVFIWRCLSVSFDLTELLEESGLLLDFKCGFSLCDSFVTSTCSFLCNNTWWCPLLQTVFTKRGLVLDSHRVPIAETHCTIFLNATRVILLKFFQTLYYYCKTYLGRSFKLASQTFRIVWNSWQRLTRPVQIETTGETGTTDLPRK